MAEFGEFDAGNFTLYYEPAYAVITGFAPDESGYTFSGINKLDFTPFSYFEIHTDSDFNVLGFTLEDPNKEDSWVEFMMISSGETSTDETIALSALPYVLVDLSEFSDDDSEIATEIQTTMIQMTAMRKRYSTTTTIARRYRRFRMLDG